MVRTGLGPGGRFTVALMLCVGILVVPILLLPRPANGGAQVASADSVHRTAAAIPRAPTPPPALPALPAPATATARLAPVLATAVPARPLAAVPVRVELPTTTTTTTIAPTTTTTPLIAPQGIDRGIGQVTYYDHPAGRCASPWLPFGTVVSVTNPATGATVTCMVDDREADTARGIDLSMVTFAQLAPLSQGVVDARLRW